jgi:predicted NBD/HSP70 family sugar kinase
MTMVNNGRQCYCGNTGCADTILGLRYLEEEINMSVEQLFTNLRYHDPDAEETMHSYLKRLAVLIRNVQMIASCDVIIGGYMENFLTSEEYEYLQEQLKQMRLLQGSTIRIIPGHYADHAAVVGAGLIRVRRFLDAV